MPNENDPQEPVAKKKGGKLKLVLFSLVLLGAGGGGTYAAFASGMLGAHGAKEGAGCRCMANGRVAGLHGLSGGAAEGAGRSAGAYVRARMRGRLCANACARAYIRIGFATVSERMGHMMDHIMVHIGSR